MSIDKLQKVLDPKFRRLMNGYLVILEKMLLALLNRAHLNLTIILLSL